MKSFSRTCLTWNRFTNRSMSVTYIEKHFPYTVIKVFLTDRSAITLAPVLYVLIISSSLSLLHSPSSFNVTASQIQYLTYFPKFPRSYLVVVSTTPPYVSAFYCWSPRFPFSNAQLTEDAAHTISLKIDIRSSLDSLRRSSSNCTSEISAAFLFKAHMQDIASVLAMLNTEGSVTTGSPLLKVYRYCTLISFSSESNAQKHK